MRSFMIGQSYSTRDNGILGYAAALIDDKITLDDFS